MSAYEVVAACDAFDLVSAVSRRFLDLDEPRTASDRAHLTGHIHLLTCLPPLIDCYIHLHSERYQSLLLEYGRGLSPPHAVYLRSQRRRRVLRWSVDERVQSSEECLLRIERVLQCFSRALHSSPCAYLFSRQPSSADVMLAAYIAFLALAPHDDGPATTRTEAVRTSSSSQQVPSSSTLPFVPLSSLLASHPLLSTHSRLLFDRFFPAFSFQPPPQSVLPPAGSLSAAAAPYSSASAVSEFERRSADSVAAAGEAEERVGGAAGLLADLRSRLSEQSLPRGQFRAPMQLPVRGGDQWVEQSKAALPVEDRERMLQRSRRMWLLGGAALVLTFVLWQRNKVSHAAVTADAAALSINTT